MRRSDIILLLPDPNILVGVEGEMQGRAGFYPHLSLSAYKNVLPSARVVIPFAVGPKPQASLETDSALSVLSCPVY